MATANFTTKPPMLLHELTHYMGFNYLALIGQHVIQTITVDTMRSLEVGQLSGLLGVGPIEDNGQKSKVLASESVLL